MDPLEVKRMRDEHEAELAANRPPPIVERIARRFHEVYEDFAPSFGWQSQSPVEWEKLPEANRQLMLAVVGELLSQDEIVAGTVHGSFEAYSETHPLDV
jgi:hypothetical protein